MATLSDFTNRMDYLEDTKQILCDFINACGVECDIDDSFRSYADKIANIGVIAAEKDMPAWVYEITLLHDSCVEIQEWLDDGAGGLKKDVTDCKTSIADCINQIAAWKYTYRNAMRYMGQVEKYSDLAAKEATAYIGDTYDVIEYGHDFCWTGTTWNDIGGGIKEYVVQEIRTPELASQYLVPSEKATSTHVFAEKTRAVTAEEALAANLTQEINRAKASETTLTTNLSAEVTRATGIETGLRNDLTSEISRATGIEAGLRADLTSETNRATSAEETLTTNLASEVTRATGIETELRNDLTAETSRATTKENTIESNLNSEISRATGIENSLRADLTAETNRATSAEEVLTSNLSTEVSRATSAEEALSANLTQEISRATGIEDGLRTDLTSEINTARSAESTLTTNLANEISRATGIENGLRTDLTSEVTRATGIESGLRTDLTAEVSRSTTKDTALEAKIDQEIQDRKDIIITDFTTEADDTHVYSSKIVYDDYTYTNNDVISGSLPGIDADTLDGYHASYFGVKTDVTQNANNIVAETTRATTAENTKVNISQGTEYSGRVLTVNSSGNIVPSDPSVIADSTVLVGSNKPIQSQAMQSYVDAEKTRAMTAEATKVDKTFKINDLPLSSESININGSNATLYGYVKPETVGGTIYAVDTINTAIGKLETKVDSATSSGITSVSITGNPEGIVLSYEGKESNVGKLKLAYSGSVDQNKVLASPVNNSGVVSFRTLDKADIPNIDISQVNSLNDTLSTKATNTALSSEVTRATNAESSLSDRVDDLEDKTKLSQFTDDLSSSSNPVHTHSQYELSANKVDSWSETVSSTKYPTENLLNETLDSSLGLTKGSGITATTTVACGGIAKGTTLSNLSVASILEKLLYPYVAPTNLALSITKSPSGTQEYGTSATIQSAKATWTAGSTSINTAVLSGDASMTKTSPSSGVVFDFDDITISGSETKSFTVTLNPNGASATPVAKTVSISNTYAYPYYAGTCQCSASELTASVIQANKKSLGNPSSYTVTTSDSSLFIAVTSKITKVTDGQGVTDYTKAFGTPAEITLSSSSPVWSGKKYYVYVGPRGTATSFTYKFTY